MADKKIGEHRFKLGGNGGEEISLTTTYFANGDPGGFYTNQKLSMQSYCNSASFELYGDALDPATLRKLADELENQELLMRLSGFKRKNERKKHILAINLRLLQR